MTHLFTAPGLLKKWRKVAGSATGKNRISLFAFVMFFLASASVEAQVFTNVPAVVNGTTAFRAPSTDVSFQRGAALYRSAEMAAITPGNLLSMGFNIDSLAPASAVAGNIKIYLANTTDQTFNRSLTWASLTATPTAMTLVYDGPLSIPASLGFYDITFTTPFNFTGNGVYMAFEWSTTAPATTGAIYAANTSLAGGSASASSTGGFAPTLTASAFRPQVRFSYVLPANDFAVRGIYALGKLPNLTATKPATISALVSNPGTNNLSNVTLTLDITGANTYTATTTVASIPAGDTMIVHFPGFTPTAVGTNTVTVSAPNDDVAVNNTATWTMNVTANTISHVASGAQIAGSVGFNTGDGMLLTRYRVANGQTLYVPRVRIMIANNPASVGQKVMGVVLDAGGNIIGTSPEFTISGGDLGSMVTFNITDPSVPSVTNTVFYAGLIQFTAPAGSPGYYPLAYAAETAPKDTTYFVTGSIAGGQVPSADNRFGFMMEADLVTTLVSAPNGIVAENAISVYPNPSNGVFTVSFAGTTSEPANISVVDVTGKTVYNAQHNLNGTSAEVRTEGLSSGVYLMRVTTATQHITKQVVIK